MSLWLTGSVAAGYAVTVLGLHRFNVYRKRRRADGFGALGRLDWDCMLGGVVAPNPTGVTGIKVSPPEGGPAPRVLALGRARTADQGVALTRLVKAEADDDAFEAAEFGAVESEWLGLLSQVRDAPSAVLARLEAGQLETAPAAALREWLVLRHRLNAFSLEFIVFSVKQRLAEALARYGEQPFLYFVRAQASGAMGFTHAALDDLARAVYFSGQAEFYVRAVADMPFIEEERPALWRLCQQTLALQRD